MNRRAAAGGLAMALALGGCSVAGPQAQVPGVVPIPEVEGPVADPVRRPPYQTPRRFAEVRGLWVVRTTLKSPELIRSMVRTAGDAGFNTLIVQVRGRGDAFYRSRWEPKAVQLAEADSTFDPLAMTIREAHARGMAVHAWVNTNLVWSGDTLPEDESHIVLGHPDWLAVPRALASELFDADPGDPAFLGALRRYAVENVTTVEGVYTSPSHPAVRARVYDVWMDLADRYDLDGIHFDYVRYPSNVFDYSRGALDRFRDWVAPRLDAERLEELDALYDRDPYAFTDSLPDAWGEFRRQSVTRTVELVYQGVKARRPGLLVTAAVFPNIEDALTNRFQDWPSWVEDGIVDVVIPMAYTPRHEEFTGWIQDGVDAAERQDKIWAGIGIFLNTPEAVQEQIDIARELGTGGVVLFSFDWARDEMGLSALRGIGSGKFGR